jgi:DNA-binding CsgD family transcriptional regulator
MIDDLPATAAILPGGLTDREAQVLRLVAAGLTNSQIGEKLFISRNTVATHLRHILDKLGAANRAEATARALSLGL